MPLYTITTTLPANLDEDQIGRFSDVFGETAASASFVRLRHKVPAVWEIQWLMDGDIDQADIVATLSLAARVNDMVVTSPVIAPVPDNTDWLAQSYRSLPPFTVGPFYIHGSHTTDPVPRDLIELQVEAATAFGSGDHGTTSGCLLLLDQLQRNGFAPASILDMGCGSGILAIAAKKLWDVPVLATDIDPESIRVTHVHAETNKVDIEAIAGDGFAIIDSSYDLIIANILPAPLKDMAADAVKFCNQGGYIILSGMLLEQADDVMAVYQGLGMKLTTRMDRGEWTALLLQKI